MTPTEAGFDGNRGIRFVINEISYHIGLLRSKGKPPSETPNKDFREQLVWHYPEGAPSRLFWCNSEDKWFELSFNPIDKP